MYLDHYEMSPEERNSRKEYLSAILKAHDTFKKRKKAVTLAPQATKKYPPLVQEETKQDKSNVIKKSQAPAQGKQHPKVKLASTTEVGQEEALHILPTKKLAINYLAPIAAFPIYMGN